MDLRTRYQRSEAAVRLAVRIRDRKPAEQCFSAEDMASAIVVLLAAPAGLRKAAEPDILRMLGQDEDGR